MRSRSLSHTFLCAPLSHLSALCPSAPNHAHLGTFIDHARARPSPWRSYNRLNPGDKKPRLGIYAKREYRRPSQGFDLPVPGRQVMST